MDVFCKIIARELPATIVREDLHVIAINDIQPKAPIHILVIPKEHVESIAYVDETHGDMITRLIFTAKDIAEEQGLSGYKLVFNVGEVGGQTVDHLHLHILGGWKDAKSSQ